MVANSHEWLVSTWNVTSENEEMNLFHQFLIKLKPQHLDVASS